MTGSSRRALTGASRVRRTAIVGGFLILLSAPPITAAAQEDTDESDDDVCRVFGRVLDSVSGDPVSGASIWLEGEDGRFVAGRQSSADGSYSLVTAECESAILRVTMIGYEDHSEPFAFGQDLLRAVTVELTRAPVAVDPLTVDVARSLRLQDVGFYARKAWVESTGKDLGEFYDPEEIEGRSQSFFTVTGIVSGSRMRFMYGSGDGCGPSFYIDGKWWRNAGAAMRMLDYGILPKDIEGIEIYRPIWGSVPAEYRDPNSTSCGAIVVWTKLSRPSEPPRIEVKLCTPSNDPNGISFGGVVSDDVTGVSLPASYVTLTVSRYGGPEEEIETVADENGTYRYCDLGGWPSSVQARYGSFAAEPFAIDSTRRAPGYWEVDLKLAVVRTGSVVGVVEGGRAGLDRMEVVLEGTGLSATPNDEGFFEIHDIHPGDYAVVVRRGDEILARRDVSVRSGATEAVTLAMDVP